MYDVGSNSGKWLKALIQRHEARANPSHLLIEWHLNAVPPIDRLSDLSLSTTLVHLLKRGCPKGGPQLIEYERYPMHNQWVEVPGLTEMAAEHVLHEAIDP